MAPVTSYVDLGLEALTAPSPVMVSTGAIELKPPTAWGWVVGGIGAVFGMLGIAAALRQEEELASLSVSELRHLGEGEREFRRRRRAQFEGREVNPKHAPETEYEASIKRKAERALEKKRAREVAEAKAQQEEDARKAADKARKARAASKAQEAYEEAVRLAGGRVAGPEGVPLLAGGVSSEDAARAAHEASEQAIQAYQAERAGLEAEIQVATERGDATVAQRAKRKLESLLKKATRRRSMRACKESETPSLAAQIRDRVIRAEPAEVEGDHSGANQLRAVAMELAVPYVEAAQTAALSVSRRVAGRAKRGEESVSLGKDVARDHATEAAHEALYAFVAPDILEFSKEEGGKKKKAGKVGGVAEAAAACWKGGRVGRAIVAEAVSRAAYKGEDQTRHKGLVSPAYRCDVETAEAEVEEALGGGYDPFEEAGPAEQCLEAQRQRANAAWNAIVARAKAMAVKPIQERWELLMDSDEEIDLAREKKRAESDVKEARVAVELFAARELAEAEGERVTNIDLAKTTGWVKEGAKAPTAVSPEAVGRLIGHGQRAFEQAVSELPVRPDPLGRKIAMGEGQEEAEARRQRGRVQWRPVELARQAEAQRFLPKHLRKTPLEMRAPLIASMVRAGKCKADPRLRPRLPSGLHQADEGAGS